MNVRPDVLRQGMAQIPQSILTLNPSQYMPSQQQTGQQQPQNHIPLIHNPANSAQPIAMLSGQAGNNNNTLTTPQRYEMPYTATPAQRNQMMQPRTAQAAAAA